MATELAPCSLTNRESIILASLLGHVALPRMGPKGKTVGQARGNRPQVICSSTQQTPVQGDRCIKLSMHQVLEIRQQWHLQVRALLDTVKPRGHCRRDLREGQIQNHDALSMISEKLTWPDTVPGEPA